MCIAPGDVVAMFGSKLVAFEDKPLGEEAVYVNKQFCVVRPDVMTEEACGWYANTSMRQADINCKICNAVNAKKLCYRPRLVATKIIQPGQEIVTVYGKAYWNTRKVLVCAEPPPREKSLSIGLKWREVGLLQTRAYVEIKNVKLSNALLHGTAFSPADLQAFGFPNDHKFPCASFVEVGDKFYEPVPSRGRPKKKHGETQRMQRAKKAHKTPS